MNLLQMLVYSCLITSLFAQMSLIEIQKKKISSQDLTCIQSMRFLDQIFIKQKDNEGQLVPSVELKEIQKLSLIPHIVVEITGLEIKTPEQSSTKWAKYLSVWNYKSLWISFSQKDTAKILCSNFITFMVSLQNKINKKLGIGMNQYQTDRFVDFDTCNQLGAFPLFYMTGFLFRPFGWWSDYQLQYNLGFQGYCNVDQFTLITVPEVTKLRKQK